MKIIPRKVKRGIIYRRCSCCKEYKPTFEFYPSSSNALDRLQNYCKKCETLRQRIYRQHKRQNSEEG